MSGKVQGYIPYRINASKCRTGKCPILPVFNHTNNSFPNLSCYMLTSMRLRQAVEQSGSGQKNQRWEQANKTLNAFGRWEGAPGGSGCVRKNKF